MGRVPQGVLRRCDFCGLCVATYMSKKMDSYNHSLSWYAATSHRRLHKSLYGSKVQVLQILQFNHLYDSSGLLVKGKS